MKMILLCVLILGTLNLYAQEQKEDVQNLPVLQEWYSWKGARAAKISYLPNFYGKGGQHAITQKRDGKSTWFNRFPFDTTNQFTWKDSYFVAQGDFNNDGFHDYWCAGCYVYKGYAKDSMPEKEPVQQYNVLGADPYVMDINNDGYDDILMINNTGRTLVSCVFGQKDLVTMKVTTVPTFWTNDEFKLAHTVGVYTNEEKKPRIIIYTLRDYFEGFYLYGIRTENKGDSVHVFLDELDKIEETYLYKDHKAKYDGEISGIYQEKNGDIPFVNVFQILENGQQYAKAIGYIVRNDTIYKSTDDVPGGGNSSYLSGSVDADTIRDFLVPDIIKVNDVQRVAYLLYSNHPLKSDRIAKAYFIEPSCALRSDVKYIGDVNGDGIGDIGYGCLEKFHIFLGIDWRTVGINPDSPSTQFTLYQNEPNPVQKDRNTLIPVSLQKEGIYSLFLYNIQGIIVKKLFEGLLPYGEIKIPLDLKGIPSGMYIVKMSNDTNTRERAIIISE